MSGGFTGLVSPGQAHLPDARPHAGPSATPAELETMGIPVGELIEDTASLDARMHHATMHLS
jgi:hypothetical protein